MERRIIGVAPPVKRAEPIYPIINVKPGECLDLLLLGDSPWGVWVHFQQGGRKGRGESYLCFGSDHGCLYCGKLPRVWAGYHPCGDMAKKVLRCLCYGAQGWENLAALAGPDRAFRGMRLYVERSGASPRSRLAFREHDAPPPYPLPDCPDLAATLRNVFAVAALPGYVAGPDVLPPEEGGGL